LLWRLDAHAATTVQDIHTRGALRCGVSDGVPGLAAPDATGQWHGLETDFCRAVAAAVLGDAQRVKFVPLRASERFPALLTDRVDLLLGNTTWTLSREALLRVRFPATLLHDGQSFMVPAASGARDPKDLNGAVVCVEKDTTHNQRLRDLATNAGLALQPLIAESATTAADDFFAGRCAALTGEAAQLAALRLRAGKTPADYRILPRAISREPIGPVVRADDPAWETIVRWVAYGLILAEEYGITGQSAGQGKLPIYAEAWGVTNEQEFLMIAQGLGLEPGWLMRSIGAAGNYGEMFERNLGKGSALGLERGPNRLWRDGGLMYAPPIK
jgi:general L-amino acid transport system substrate-binding protein